MTKEICAALLNLQSQIQRCATSTDRTIRVLIGIDEPQRMFENVQNVDGDEQMQQGMSEIFKLIHRCQKKVQTGNKQKWHLYFPVLSTQYLDQDEDLTTEEVMTSSYRPQEDHALLPLYLPFPFDLYERAMRANKTVSSLDDCANISYAKLLGRPL